MPRQHSSTWNTGDNVSASRLQDINEDLDDIYSLGNDRGRIWEAASGTPLMIDIAPFNWRVGTTTGQFGGDTDIALTDDATNYVEIKSDNTIAINTTTWTTANGRLGTVTCVGGEITAISIWKPDVVGGELGSSTLVNVETLSGNKTLTSTAKYYQILNPNGTARDVTLETTNMSEGNHFVVRNVDDRVALTMKQSSTVITTLYPKQTGVFVFDGTNWTLALQEQTDESYYGDGRDGDVTLTGDATLTRDMHYMNLNLSTFTLNTAGYRVFVRGVCSGSGKIKAPTGGNGGNGGNGSNSTGGTAGTAGTAAAGVTVTPGQAGVAGGAGASGLNNGNAGTAGPSKSNAVIAITGAAGGAGGDVSNRTGGAGGAAGTSTIHTAQISPKFAYFFADISGGTYTRLNAGPGSGGGGGGAGNAANAGGGGGGGSGANGGNIVAFIYRLSGTWNFESIGGNGGNGGNGFSSSSQAGGGGGGSGGNGGAVLLGYRDKASWSGGFTLTAGSGGTGGIAGEGGGSGSPGANGSSGTAGSNVQIIY
jgi:hypothetical protein